MRLQFYFLSVAVSVVCLGQSADGRLEGKRCSKWTVSAATLAFTAEQARSSGFQSFPAAWGKFPHPSSPCGISQSKEDELIHFLPWQCLKPLFDELKCQALLENHNIREFTFFVLIASQGGHDHKFVIFVCANFCHKNTGI